jgi:hypothetical protein
VVVLDFKNWRQESGKFGLQRRKQKITTLKAASAERVGGRASVPAPDGAKGLGVGAPGKFLNTAAKMIQFSVLLLK